MDSAWRDKVQFRLARLSGQSPQEDGYMASGCALSGSGY